MLGGIIFSWYVYDDSNENGILDKWEKTMAWRKIFIDENLDWECQENSKPFNLTNNDGYYEFDSFFLENYK